MFDLTTQDTTDSRWELRIWLAALIMFVAMGILIARLWQQQMIRSESYLEMSRKNRIRLIRLSPSRGRILDSSGQVLAKNGPGFTLSVVPGELRDPEEVIRVSSPVVGMAPERIRHKIEQSKSSPRFMAYPLKKNLSLEQASLIKSRGSDLTGVVLGVETRRIYPLGESLCHVIGIMGEISKEELVTGARLGYRPGDPIGKSGIEKEYEGYLKGVEGWERIEIDAKGRQLADLGREDPVRGADITLTVDASLQCFVEEVFDRRAGSVVAVEPDSGRILAAVSKPGFDLNLFSPSISEHNWNILSNDSLHPLENRSIRGLYSPASAFKIVTAAAGLSEGVVNPSDQVVCKGRLELAGQVFRCWNRHGHGKVDLKRAIVESCDIYFYRLGLKLGPDRIARSAALFGLGKPTGMELPQELPGLIPTRNWKSRVYGDSWKDGETVTFAIGQGYLVCTPIQMAMMTAAVANGGRLLKPSIVEKITGPDGQVMFENAPAVRWELPYNIKDMLLLRDFMRKVVSTKAGTGKKARIPGIHVSGKTGTSQVIRQRHEVKSQDGVPYHERTHAIFIGYVDDMPKKIALVVIVEHGGPGGESAAPIARKIIARYYNRPDPGDPEE
ncbi:penicillin-binding protein 2 [Thermodesulfobacteriota bacterium]